jgi:hypothetical protein
MKLFVDTGNVKEVETLAALGILDGVTTNPTLLSKESGDYRENRLSSPSPRTTRMPAQHPCLDQPERRFRNSLKYSLTIP